MKYSKIIALTVIAISIMSCKSEKPEATCDLSVIEDKLITPDIAKEWAEIYTRTRYDSLTRALGFEDNRTTWYSIEELENYILYAKQEAKKKGITINGFRLHLAVNPDNFYQERGPLTTIYIAPTKPYRQEGAFFTFQPGGGGEDTDIHALEHGSNGNPPNTP